MRIAVHGVGAIGGSIGGFLAQSGEDVLLVDEYAEHVAAMQRGGLILDGIVGDHTVPVTAITVAEMDQVKGVFDVVVIGVKSYDTVKAVRRMLPFMTARVSMLI